VDDGLLLCQGLVEREEVLALDRLLAVDEKDGQVVMGERPGQAVGRRCVGLLFRRPAGQREGRAAKQRGKGQT
jgi:hypothetical protein